MSFLYTLFSLRTHFPSPLRLGFLLGVGALFMANLTACGRAPLYRQESFVFGTRVELLIAGVDEASARPAAAARIIPSIAAISALSLHRSNSPGSGVCTGSS